MVDPDPNQPSPEQPGDFDPSDPSVSDPLRGPLAEYESQNLQSSAMLIACPDAVVILCGMAGFWAVTYFNPWMHAALGIAAYAICRALPGI